MRHAELLHDPASIERGEELVSLYIDSLHRLRADTPTEEEQDKFDDYEGGIREVLEEAAEKSNMDSAAYEQLGRSLVEMHRQYERVEALGTRRELGTPEWRAAFQPAFDFLAMHDSKPIAAEQTRKNHNDIAAYRIWGSRSPKTIGGFVIPKVTGNTGLHISRQAGSRNAVARLQVFDRDWTSKGGVHYRSYLKIAIGE